MKLAYIAESQSRSKTISKGSSRPRCTKTGENRVLWSDYSKFAIFGSNIRVGERAATSCTTPNVQYGGSSVLLGWGIFLIAKSGICTRCRENCTRSAFTAYCSITRSHLESS